MEHFIESSYHSQNPDPASSSTAPPPQKLENYDFDDSPEENENLPPGVTQVTEHGQCDSRELPEFRDRIESFARVFNRSCKVTRKELLDKNILQGLSSFHFAKRELNKAFGRRKNLPLMIELELLKPFKNQAEYVDCLFPDQPAPFFKKSDCAEYECSFKNEKNYIPNAGALGNFAVSSIYTGYDNIEDIAISAQQQTYKAHRQERINERENQKSGASNTAGSSKNQVKKKTSSKNSSNKSRASQSGVDNNTNSVEHSNPPKTNIAKKSPSLYSKFSASPHSNTQLSSSPQSVAQLMDQSSPLTDVKDKYAYLNYLRQTGQHDNALIRTEERLYNNSKDGRSNQPSNITPITTKHNGPPDSITQNRTYLQFNYAERSDNSVYKDLPPEFSYDAAGNLISGYNPLYDTDKHRAQLLQAPLLQSDLGGGGNSQKSNKGKSSKKKNSHLQASVLKSVSFGNEEENRNSGTNISAQPGIIIGNPLSPNNIAVSVIRNSGSKADNVTSKNSVLSAAASKNVVKDNNIATAFSPPTRRNVLTEGFTPEGTAFRFGATTPQTSASPAKNSNTGGKKAKRKSDINRNIQHGNVSANPTDKFEFTGNATTSTMASFSSPVQPGNVQQNAILSTLSGAGTNNSGIAGFGNSDKKSNIHAGSRAAGRGSRSPSGPARGKYNIMNSAKDADNNLIIDSLPRLEKTISSNSHVSAFGYDYDNINFERTNSGGGHNAVMNSASKNLDHENKNGNDKGSNDANPFLNLVDQFVSTNHNF